METWLPIELSAIANCRIHQGQPNAASKTLIHLKRISMSPLNAQTDLVLAQAHPASGEAIVWVSGIIGKRKRERERKRPADSTYRVFQVSGENQSINVIKHVIRASN